MNSIICNEFPERFGYSDVPIAEVLFFPFDYVICGNGAIIADRNCNILQRFDLEYHLALELLAICSKQAGVAYGISDGDRFGAAKIENVDMSDEMFCMNFFISKLLPYSWARSSQKSISSWYS